ncbi:MAG: iron ABC transporter permease [Candidatus Eisenbacteria bacterium]|uniref:Iron ABC transporter permease n=1 Tax=Eiseniibacteriota bacterium TaxID=2212470 RepID=A0A938BMD6_UNCEI|nr:iron ABC transporter permease [Candidatus Eisenbacteria bacterium]
MRAARRWKLWTAILGLALVASGFLSLGIGSADVGVGDAWKVVAGALSSALRGAGLESAPGEALDAGASAGASAGGAVGTRPGAAQPDGADQRAGLARDRAVAAPARAADPAARIVLQLRLPRTILSLLAGGLLAIAGVVMQAFFRNPMADPYLVGVSAGAALGAVLAMLLGWTLRFAWFSPVPLAAFSGALVAVGIVYAVHRAPGGTRAEGLLLSGLAASAAISAVVALLLVTSQRAVQQVLFWLLGSLAAARWDHVLIVLPYALIGLVVVCLLARDLDLLLWGDATGAALGAHVARTRALLLGAASLMAAAVVAVSGVVGFVGLMVPHAARFLVGTGHRRLLPSAFLLGGLLLLWADILARTLRSPTELPLGAITAIIGAPFLVYLCARSGRKRW